MSNVREVNGMGHDVRTFMKDWKLSCVFQKLDSDRNETCGSKELS